MKRIKTLIIEDDPLNALAVCRVIEKHFPEINIVGKAERVNEAVDKINSLQPELLLMDIHLIDGTSFDVIKLCKNMDFKIVFMSAYHEYAVKALQHAAVEFVFKPFDINELVIAIDKAIDELLDQNYRLKIQTLFNNIEHNEHQIILQGKTNFRVFNVNEIAWGKAIQGGANFYMTDNSYYFAAKPLRRYEAMLTDHSFFRCHPHYLINLNQVKEVKPELQRIKMNTGDEVMYEDRRYDQLIELLELSKMYA
ncbi:response regulator transcription factor [Carboxylicivirga sediminis]|uniref:Response regulator transcription factor n=1 Tax=Carboxylicivirga sediminis TaxID=2006564 RepID=A0A941F2I7_9BACT|nr:LytTR family DNA-binding domain-containing protein [Carboxylicivirga sediminis]MBR8535596.1 response regulator transcription factor [Carboxylicivirga sediminis]